MSRIPVWKQLSGKRLTQKDLQRAIRSLQRCTTISKEEREGEEWALTLRWANDNGY